MALNNYNKGDAKLMPEGLWIVPTGTSFLECYNASEAFETAVFDRSTGEPVGKPVVGFDAQPSSEFNKYNLVVKVRRVADVNSILDAKRTKREHNARARDAAKVWEQVTHITYDVDWNVTELVNESRTIYSNKDGTRHIKTRSNGSPRVHRVGDKNYVVYGPVYRPSNPTRYDIRPLRVLPAECPLT